MSGLLHAAAASPKVRAVETRDLIRRPSAIAIMLVLSAAVLAGCGRRGALEPPPGAAATSGETTAQGQPGEPQAHAQQNGTPASPAGGSAVPGVAGEAANPLNRGQQEPDVLRARIPAPKRDFILDKLL